MAALQINQQGRTKAATVQGTYSGCRGATHIKGVINMCSAKHMTIHMDAVTKGLLCPGV